jgi:hypothetical protein
MYRNYSIKYRQWIARSKNHEHGRRYDAYIRGIANGTLTFIWRHFKPGDGSIDELKAIDYTWLVKSRESAGQNPFIQRCVGAPRQIVVQKPVTHTASELYASWVHLDGPKSSQTNRSRKANHRPISILRWPKWPMSGGTKVTAKHKVDSQRGLQMQLL